MVKASGIWKDGRRVAFVGLSEGNWRNLREGRPIAVDLEPLGIEGRLVILGDETEQDIVRTLGRRYRLGQWRRRRCAGQRQEAGGG